jgi:CRP-like cAMP-binding protein
MDCRSCENSHCFINKNCSEEWLQYVQKVKTISNISERKRIFSEGEIARGIFVVCDGKVMLNMQIDKMSHEVIRLAGAGQILGHRGFYNEMKYPVSAETLSQVETSFIPYDSFLKLIRENADLSSFLVSFFASELLQSDRKHRLNATNAIREKVEFALQRIYGAFGFEEYENTCLIPGLDLDNLANFASVSPEDLIETLDELKEESILGLEDERINVIDKAFFQANTYN